jgi:hypothetical protein
LKRLKNKFGGGWHGMMRQLFKRGPDGIRYWEVWEGDGTVIIHRGRLGDGGETENLTIQPEQSAKEVIDREIEMARTEGYKFLRPPRKSNFVIRYGVEGLTRARYERKNERVWELVSQTLVRTANGYAYGDRISDDERTVDIHASVLDPPTAMATLVAALKRARLHKGVIIAYRGKDQQCRVLWPEGFQGTFLSL